MPFNYVGIRVRSLERSLLFYKEGLGLVEITRGSMSHGGVFVELEDPTTHQRLELNWYPEGSAYDAPYLAGEGLDHLGFDVDDVEKTIGRLVSLGGKVAVKPWVERGDSGRYLIGFVEDPDGIWVEVAEHIG
ncbi:MAG: VOC family protein [Thermoprotei archaeon]